MTRDEALKKIPANQHKLSEYLLDALMALGLLTLDEPKAAAESETLEWLARAIRQHVSVCSILAFKPEDARPVLRQLEHAGFRLTKNVPEKVHSPHHIIFDAIRSQKNFVMAGMNADDLSLEIVRALVIAGYLK